MGIRLTNIIKKIDSFTLDIDLEVKKGELVSLLGPSGCGKTTTLRIIAGFIDQDRGSVSIANKEISNLPPEKRNIGMVFQDYALFPHMTVFENIAYGPRIRKWSKDKINYSVERFLKIVHLKGYSKRKIENLSGGEQQRVALARALITEPELLLLDEPLSALDAKLRKKLRREIRKIQKELKITTIYVTHDQEEALSISDRIAVMDKGKCIQFANPKTLFTKPSQIISASFIGNSNIIEIDSIIQDSNKKIVNTKIGLFNVGFISKTDSGKLYLFFRPEFCRPAEKGETENVFSGIIIDEEYSGDHTNIEINCNGIIIKAILNDLCIWGIDDSISIFIPPEYCRVIE